MLEISTKKAIITPFEPCLMGGYAMRTEKSQGALDDLTCTVIAMKIDGKQIVFCELDLIMVDAKIVNAIKDNVSGNSSISPEFIFVGTTHTHAGPELRFSRITVFGDRDSIETIDRYEDFLIENITKNIFDCINGNFVSVDAYYKTISIDGVYGNRNGKDKIEDKDFTLIKFMDGEGKAVAAIANISCHPTVLGAKNLMISGDLLGYIARAIHSELGVYPLMMQGAAGDMSNRNYRLGHDEKEVERSGSKIISQVFACDKFEKLTLKQAEIEDYNYYFEYDLDVDEAVALRDMTEKQMENEKDYDKHKILLSGVAALEMKLKSPHVVCDFNAHIIRLGDIEICAHSGEMFSRFGIEIKSSSKAKLPLIWGYVNEYSGYMTNEEEYNKNYESMMSPFPRGASEQITRELCEII